MKELCQKYGLTEKELNRILLSETNGKPKPLNLYFSGKRYVFGVVSDTHLCSKEERLTELTTFYEICRRRKITNIYHAGDIIDGQSLYTGHEYEVHTFGLDHQVNYAVKHYPHSEGITTHFITGN